MFTGPRLPQHSAQSVSVGSGHMRRIVSPSLRPTFHHGTLLCREYSVKVFARNTILPAHTVIKITIGVDALLSKRLLQVLGESSLDQSVFAVDVSDGHSFFYSSPFDRRLACNYLMNPTAEVRITAKTRCCPSSAI